MSLPSKDELLKEITALVEGETERLIKELERDAEQLKKKYFTKIEDVCSSVSL
jgi:lipoate-protein ligase A